MKSAIQLAATELNPQGGIFCPSKQAGMELWNNHPRVFLDIGKTGHAKCPYCGTAYQLRAGEQVHVH